MIDRFQTPFGSPSSIAAYTLTQMGFVSLFVKKERDGSQVTLGHGFQAAPKFRAMKVQNLHL